MLARFFNQNYKLLSIIMLLLLGLIAYSNTFHNSFHFDDESSITDNFAIRNIRNLRNIWNFWPTRFIAYLSIAINYQWGGLRVFGYHVFNFLLHLGSAILIWRLTILTLNTPLIKKEIITAYAKPIAFFTSTIFLLHPIQTQPVNYIVQRATLLATFFYIASLILYIQARLKQKQMPGSHIWKVYYISSLLTAVMSMFSKEIAIALPLGICLYEFCFLRTKKKINWKYIVPFLIIILIIPLTMLITKSVDFKGMRRVIEDYPGISAGHYFLTQLRVMVTYIRLLFIPLNQNLDYDYPVAKSIFEMPIFFSFLLLLLILLAGIRLFYRYRLVSFGIFWFFITLLPESSVIPIKDVIFEHRLYLPMVGYSLFLVSGLYYLFKEKKVKFMITILSLLVICYSVITHQRNKVWENDFTLWDDTVRKSPQKERAYNNRGSAYQNQGDFTKAISDFNKALQLNLDFAEAYYSRGIAYFKIKEYNRSLDDLSKAQLLGLKVSPQLLKELEERIKNW